MSELGPITAELRRVMNHTTMAGIPLVEIGEYEFGHRCDAIDAVHAGLERENAELRRQLDSLLYECRPMTDENMAESGWVRLPVDADGVPIHVGDVIVTTEWHEEVVEGILPERVLVLRDGEWFTIRADWCRHHAPTVEDVLRNVVTLCHNTWKEESPFHFYDVDDVMKSGNIADFAAKLRLAEGEDA